LNFLFDRGLAILVFDKVDQNFVVLLPEVKAEVKLI